MAQLFSFHVPGISDLPQPVTISTRCLKINRNQPLSKTLSPLNPTENPIQQPIKRQSQPIYRSLPSPPLKIDNTKYRYLELPKTPLGAETILTTILRFFLYCSLHGCCQIVWRRTKHISRPKNKPLEKRKKKVGCYFSGRCRPLKINPLAGTILRLFKVGCSTIST